MDREKAHLNAPNSWPAEVFGVGLSRGPARARACLEICERRGWIHAEKILLILQHINALRAPVKKPAPEKPGPKPAPKKLVPKKK